MDEAYGEYQLQLVAAGEDGLKQSTMIVMESNDGHVQWSTMIVEGVAIVYAGAATTIILLWSFIADSCYPLRLSWHSIANYLVTPVYDIVTCLHYYGAPLSLLFPAATSGTHHIPCTSTP